MDKDGSVSKRTRLPAVLAPVVVVAGMASMLLLGRPAFVLGLRPALLISEIALALPGLLAIVAFGIPLVTGLGLRPLSSQTTLAVAGAAAALWVASLGLFEVQYAVWAPPPGYLEAFERLHEMLQPSNAAEALFSVAAIAIAPAICEELVLRGMVLPSLIPLGRPAAVVISAALFALIHLDPYRSAFTFALGLALGVLRLRSGSLLAPVLAHALVNTITFVAAPFTDDTSGGLPEPQPLLGLALLAVGTAFSLLALRHVRVVDSPEAGA